MANLESAIRDSIERVNAEIRRHPLAFLTESDVQCRLYAALLQDYGSMEPVSNTHVWGTTNPQSLQPIQSTRLHSELLLPEGRIDLAVLDLRSTRYAFNSKGRFGYVQLESGNHVFIEIKVSRTHRSGVSTKARWLQFLRADLEKLSRYSWRSFLLAYDFDFQLPQEEINALSMYASPNTRVIYLKDDFQCCYFEKPPNKAISRTRKSSAPVS